jgi:Fe-S-cluster containining protein
MKKPQQWPKHVLVEAVDRMTDAERRNASALMRDFREGIKRASTTVNAESLAYSIHLELDDATNRMLAQRAHDAQPVSCRKGCAACCYCHVSVTPQEAALLVYFAHEQGVKIDRDKLRRQAQKNLQTWNTLAPVERACVFLASDNTCAVHEHRPGACRKYLVVTDPRHCDTIRFPGHRVGVLFSLEGELMQEAALSALGSGSLAAQLLRALDAVKS